MRLVRDVIGIILVFLVWFNPLGLGTPLRIVLFIIGFDAMTIFSKLAVFVADFFLGFFDWLGFTLLILVGADLVIGLFKKQKAWMLVKPVFVFIVALIPIGPELALIAAGVDLVLNIGIGN